MLTKEEKQELRELAASAKVREEFRLLRKNSQAWQRQVDADQFLSYLTAMSRLNPKPPLPRVFVRYPSVKL